MRPRFYRLASGERQQKRQYKNDRHKLVLLDARGKQLSSEELAEFLEREQMNAISVLFAIGGSDGFSEEARRQAAFTLSLGKMTLPHELARVVLVEQLYRAFHHPEEASLSFGTLTDLITGQGPSSLLLRRPISVHDAPPAASQ